MAKYEIPVSRVSARDISQKTLEAAVCGTLSRMKPKVLLRHRSNRAG